MKRYFLILLAPVWAGLIYVNIRPAFDPPSAHAQSFDCQFNGSFTATGTSSAQSNVIANTANVCQSFTWDYQAYGFSALSIQIEGAPYNSAGTGPGSWTTLSSPTSGSNPATAAGAATVVFKNVFYPFIRLHLTSITGSGKLTWRVYGNITAKSSGSGGVTGPTGPAGPTGAQGPTGPTGSGGGSATAGSITTLPVSPSAGQLYFATDSLYTGPLFFNGASWDYFFLGQLVTPPTGTFAWTNQNGATVTQQTNGAWSFVFAGTAGTNLNYEIFDTATPSTPFTQIYRFTGTLENGVNQPDMGVSLRESGTGKLIVLALTPFLTSSTCLITGTTTGNGPCWAPFTVTTPSAGVRAQVGTLGPGMVGNTQPYCVKVTVASGATGAITYSYSVDNGLTFTQLYSAAKNTFFTTGPDNVGVYGNPTDLTSNFNLTMQLLSID